MIPKFEDVVSTEWLYNEFANEYELRVRFSAIFKHIVPGYFFEKVRESVRKECVDELRRQVHKCSEETCKLERTDWDDGMHWTWGCVCTACNAHLEHETGIGYYNFCPVCGRRVIKDA